MTRFSTRQDGCTIEPALGTKRPKLCPHGHPYESEKALRRSVGSSAGDGIGLRGGEVDDKTGAASRTPRRKPLKRGRGFSVAPAQRAKVKLLVCLGCGREVDPDAPGDWTIDPAHLVTRSAGGCDDPLCVLPLCRHRFQPGVGCHPIFDGQVADKSIDLHPRLARGGYEKELAHAIELHGLTPIELVERVTGEPYRSTANLLRELDLAKARIIELEARVHA